MRPIAKDVQRHKHAGAELQRVRRQQQEEAAAGGGSSSRRWWVRCGGDLDYNLPLRRRRCRHRAAAEDKNNVKAHEMRGISSSSSTRPHRGRGSHWHWRAQQRRYESKQICQCARDRCSAMPLAEGIAAGRNDRSGSRHRCGAEDMAAVRGAGAGGRRPATRDGGVMEGG